MYKQQALFPDEPTAVGIIDCIADGYRCLMQHAHDIPVARAAMFIPNWHGQGADVWVLSCEETVSTEEEARAWVECGELPE